jgi:outer membrane receptor protein involved in Fe transport
LYPNEYSKNAPNSGDTLKVARIQNYDVRYELYPAMGEMISIGGFYKSFQDPIMRAVLNSSDNKSFTFINAKDGYCYGLELDVRKNLGVFDSLLGTRIFGNFTFVGNLTLTQSQINVDTNKRQELNDLTPKSKLQGQSPYILNLGMYFQNSRLGLQGSLLYNVFGARLYAIGKTVAGSQSIGEMPVETLDFTVSKLFFKHYILTLGVQNLLDSRVVYMLDMNKDGKFDSKHDLEYKTYNPGRYYTVGVKVKF